MQIDGRTGAAGLLCSTSESRLGKRMVAVSSWPVGKSGAAVLQSGGGSCPVASSCSIQPRAQMSSACFVLQLRGAQK